MADTSMTAGFFIIIIDFLNSYKSDAPGIDVCSAYPVGPLDPTNQKLAVVPKFGLNLSMADHKWTKTLAFEPVHDTPHRADQDRVAHGGLPLPYEDGHLREDPQLHRPAVEAHAPDVDGSDPVRDRRHHGLDGLHRLPEHQHASDAGLRPDRVPDPDRRRRRARQQDHLHHHVPGLHDGRDHHGHQGAGHIHDDRHPHIVHLDHGHGVIDIHVGAHHSDYRPVTVRGLDYGEVGEPVDRHVRHHEAVVVQDVVHYRVDTLADEHVDVHVRGAEHSLGEDVEDQLDHGDMPDRFDINTYEIKRLGSPHRVGHGRVYEGHYVRHRVRHGLVDSHRHPGGGVAGEVGLHVFDAGRDLAQVRRWPLVAVGVPGPVRGVVTRRALLHHRRQLGDHHRILHLEPRERAIGQPGLDDVTEPLDSGPYRPDVGGNDVHGHVRDLVGQYANH
ncbi:hypothetical protein FALBO_13030 [Fusarium albosuccineum]|uniref:Uncharacterized protein n=1 Tax=Fusarium albosuccineum TaxID=1237068 RepID=A0A8H4L2T3_9HYPO|nr:hypothetical protein FALBO_13030 [Fusarium albosuccineum]